MVALLTTYEFRLDPVDVLLRAFGTAMTDLDCVIGTVLCRDQGSFEVMDARFAKPPTRPPRDAHSPSPLLPPCICTAVAQVMSERKSASSCSR
eukprot:3235699-Pleurochrysis_carterae.AAC.1